MSQLRFISCCFVACNYLCSLAGALCNFYNQEMDYKAPRRHTAALETTDFKDSYPHDIQMYDIPPIGEMSLEDFHELGFDRLKGI